jgi:hypothetical protein
MTGCIHNVCFYGEKYLESNQGMQGLLPNLEGPGRAVGYSCVGEP